MSKEILDQIREGLDRQIKLAIEDEGILQHHVHQVVQSYLLLQILDRLANAEIIKLNPEYK